MHRLFSSRAVLCITLLGAVISACTPALDWREHRFDDGGFSILLPQQPGRSERKLATPAGDVTMKMVSVRVDETVFGAASAGFAQPPDAPAQEAMRNALLKNFAGSIVSDKPVTAGPLAGREVIKRGPFGAGDGANAATEGELRARFFVKGTRYFQVIAAGRRGAVADTDLDLFFTSFKPD